MGLHIFLNYLKIINALKTPKNTKIYTKIDTGGKFYMKLLKFKYALIPIVVLFFSTIIQVPMINFVKAESSRYMLTNYRENVKEDILKVVEVNVKSKLKESLKSEVIQELRTELLDEVMDNLKIDLTKEIREGRQWIKSPASKVKSDR